MRRQYTEDKAVRMGRCVYVSSVEPLEQEEDAGHKLRGVEELVSAYLAYVVASGSAGRCLVLAALASCTGLADSVRGHGTCRRLVRPRRTTVHKEDIEMIRPDRPETIAWSEKKSRTD